MVLTVFFPMHTAHMYNGRQLGYYSASMTKYMFNNRKDECATNTRDREQ